MSETLHPQHQVWGLLRKHFSDDKADFIVSIVAPYLEAEMTKEQEDAVYAAYMGISVLSTMCKKAGLSSSRLRSEELLKELSGAFPTVYERILLSVLR